MGAVRGCQWVSSSVGVSAVYWGAGRECRYSEASRYRWHKGALGTPRDVGAVGELLGTSGGVGGVRGVLGG